ncbi:LysE family translocator [Burkholderia multivorans]|uniref:LysE family translocator n=1 Tax=Burkholderia multivorans TaxID=87883 RepID=UPI001C959C15|nr:LysE family translocator [Burkholderia multivorans]
MFGICGFALFVGAVMLLNVTPGPDMAYVAGQSMAHGRKAGILSALGVSIGGGIHTFACALGLSALIAASPTAFIVIKWVGAIYLVYLGLQLLRRTEDTNTDTSALRPGGSFVVRGIVSNVTNPKVLFFYIAFLPQFVSPDSQQKAVALLVLGATLVILGFLTDCVIVYGAAKASGLIRKRTAAAKWLNRVVGAGFIGLGFRLAASTR